MWGGSRMRPKYRAWLKERHEMRNVKRIEFEETYSFFGDVPPHVTVVGWCDVFPIDDVILMQSTGLLDKNGVEIYEDCIVMLEDYDFKRTIRAKVVKENGAWGLVGIDRDVVEIFPENWNDNFLTFAYLMWICDSYLENGLFNVEVIGNVCENPELLEVDSNV